MNKLDLIYKKAAAKDRNLKKLYSETIEKIKKETGATVVWHDYETDCLYDEIETVERDGLKVYKYKKWISSNKYPEGAEVRDGRYAVPAVAYWRTPYNYNQNLRTESFRYHPKVLYDKSETEKVLYEDSEFKVIMLRRNVIPFFRSCQWCHKISEHEYVIYLKREELTEIDKFELVKIQNIISNLCQRKRNGELTKEQYDRGLNNLYDDRKEVYKKATKLYEIAHSEKLKYVFQKAKRYINDYQIKDY